LVWLERKGMLQKDSECGEGEVEEWKTIGMQSSWMKWGERERDEKERGERERGKKNVIKYLETEKDERFNTLLQLSFYVLKIKSK
jgi:hypothetical protein